jgi:nucleotide-binding universal stress UspA family protein
MAVLLEPGSEIDGFRIGECVHKGGMGFIYRVSGPETGFGLMMKVPRVGHGQSTDGVVGFETEVMVLSAATGAHVPRFVAAGDLSATPYLVMEWIEGDNLEHLVQRGPLPPADVARIGAALADATESLHRQDLIHLDIKPGNAMLRPDGRAVLIDFGLAHHARLPDLMAEEMRRAVGTAEYISPEQVLGVRSDPRSDIFALGVLLYELSTGELPFGSPNSVAGLRDRLWMDPRPPRAITQDMPAWLQEVILRCMEVRPEQRYPTAAQLAFDLRHPERVQLTARGQKTRRVGAFVHARRWLWASGREAEIAPPPKQQTAAAPIVLAAVDTAHLDDDLQQALHAAVLRVIGHAPNARLTCVAVLTDTPMQDGPRPDDTASGMHLEHLVRLRHWAKPMNLPAERLSVHVLEGSDTAKTLVEYARLNQVSLIVIGAANYSEPRLGLGRSITTAVSEDAPCSVYIVRSSQPVLASRTDTAPA